MGVLTLSTLQGHSEYLGQAISPIRGERKTGFNDICSLGLAPNQNGGRRASAGQLSLLFEAMMNFKFCIWFFICTAGSVYAHGGGLNAEGCYTNRKSGDYHCHRAGSVPLAKPNSAAKEAPHSQGSSGVPTCHTGPRGGTYTITKSGRKNYNGC